MVKYTIRPTALGDIAANLQRQVEELKEGISDLRDDSVMKEDKATTADIASGATDKWVAASELKTTNDNLETQSWKNGSLYMGAQKKASNRKAVGRLESYSYVKDASTLFSTKVTKTFSISDLPSSDNVTNINLSDFNFIQEAVDFYSKHYYLVGCSSATATSPSNGSQRCLFALTGQPDYTFRRVGKAYSNPIGLGVVSANFKAYAVYKSSSILYVDDISDMNAISNVASFSLPSGFTNDNEIICIGSSTGSYIYMLSFYSGSSAYTASGSTIYPSPYVGVLRINVTNGTTSIIVDPSTVRTSSNKGGKGLELLIYHQESNMCLVRWPGTSSSSTMKYITTIYLMNLVDGALTEKSNAYDLNYAFGPYAFQSAFGYGFNRYVCGNINENTYISFLHPYYVQASSGTVATGSETIDKSGMYVVVFKYYHSLTSCSILYTQKISPDIASRIKRVIPMDDALYLVTSDTKYMSADDSFPSSVPSPPTTNRLLWGDDIYKTRKTLEYLTYISQLDGFNDIHGSSSLASSSIEDVENNEMVPHNGDLPSRCFSNSKDGFQLTNRTHFNIYPKASEVLCIQNKSSYPMTDTAGLGRLYFLAKDKVYIPKIELGWRY